MSRPGPPSTAEPSDGSIDVVFEAPADAPSAELARKEISDILEAISKEARSEPPPADSDMTRRMRRR